MQSSNFQWTHLPNQEEMQKTEGFHPQYQRYRRSIYPSVLKIEKTFGREVQLWKHRRQVHAHHQKNIHLEIVQVPQGKGG